MKSQSQMPGMTSALFMNLKNDQAPTYTKQGFVPGDLKVNRLFCIQGTEKKDDHKVFRLYGIAKGEREN